MSTAALSAPHLEITAPDTMDLHSDSGLDFGDGDGDGDIDLDQRSTGGVDDDVSLRDAATGAGQDMQTLSGDQDDFMADNEDLIEEDVVVEDVQVSEEPEVAVPEEDLIDYSDEEDAAADETHLVVDTPQNDVQNNAMVIGDDDEERSIVVEPVQLDEHAREDATVSQPVDDAQGQGDMIPVQEQDPYSVQHSGEQAASEEHGQSQEDVHVEAEASGDDSHSHERKISAAAIDHSTDTSTGNVAIEQSGQDVQDNNFHPVNVHFNGHDYWLFKHHDYEGSGDYLLEDESFFTQPVHMVIDACREALQSLGKVVSNDVELGFCLDSLHNVELYEEHPTCRFFNLNDILRVYLQLYAQDGITDPEYFCITLLSRPRLTSLLAELTKAATEGIGYSGLESAITSGQTAFSAHFSHDSPAQDHRSWDEADEEEAQAVQSDHEAAEQDERGGEREGEHQEDHERANGDHHEQREEEQEHVEVVHQEEHDEQVSENAADKAEEEAAEVVASNNDVSANDPIAKTDGHVEQSAGNTATPEQDPQNLEEDLLDYSDDEYNEEPDKEVQTTQASSESATIQGDEPPQARGQLEDEVPEEQQSEHADDSKYDDGAEHAAGAEQVVPDGQAGLSDETFAEYEGHEYSYGEYDGQDYGEEYEGEYGQEYNDGQDFEDYPAYDDAQGNDENTNYHDDLGQQPADHVDDPQVTAGTNSSEPAAVEDPVQAPKDLLGLDDAAAARLAVEKQHAAEDEIGYSDEEDGSVSQALVAASGAADTVAASSSELQNLSPQGQKRTIDEVGNDQVDATQSAASAIRTCLYVGGPKMDFTMLTMSLDTDHRYFLDPAYFIPKAEKEDRHTVFDTHYFSMGFRRRAFTTSRLRLYNEGANYDKNFGREWCLGVSAPGNTDDPILSPADGVDSLYIDWFYSATQPQTPH
ncbi:hypothetical protein BU23DRAFT_594439 [Bimuria novae-zelandiae CBS 107.79]|uniref:Uncharacterized protein n=1 Tax=Bimuria novae-zelandiae CBS 107.79 TaxID=1447943 RepID=A0A6A5VS74_9PLEO|nr:hypothetical protein BU23DRAFT_594439 [Bimuria novae-zelandiae CBS 107.79]